MAYFPLFIDLQTKLCIVVGGGLVATRKIQTLLDFGAKIKVISPTVTDEITALAAAGRVKTVLREYQPSDCTEAFLIIAATSSGSLNESIYHTALANGMFVNVVDAPAMCTFFFPAVVKRQDLVIGINTAGKFPALAKWLRQKITAVLPPVYGSLLEALAPLRKKIMSITNKAQKDKIINGLLEEIEQIRTPQELEQWQSKLDKNLDIMLKELTRAKKD